jgi:hypothetical protein
VRPRVPLDRRALWLLLALLALGLALEAWLVSRAWIQGDQAILLDLGLEFLESGQLKPVAKTMSGGASIPGCLLQLLIAGPLAIWPDNRAPGLLIGLFHLAAALILARTLWQAASPRLAVIFTALYWLSPWRLYHSGFVWEPAYVFLPAAAHIWACWRLSCRRSGFASAVLATTLLLAFQLHGSALILLLSTFLLLARRSIHLEWRGLVTGTLIGALPLYPAAIAWAAGRLPIDHTGEGHIGYGIAHIYPLFKAFLYWLRLGSLDIGRLRKALPLGDGDRLDGDSEPVVQEAGAYVLLALSILSILIPLAAAWWHFRSGRAMIGESGPGPAWLRNYAGTLLVSVIVGAGLSPVSVQGWHVVIALPAACIPVAAWIDQIWPPRRRWLQWALVLFLLLRIPTALVLGSGHRLYRRERLTVPVPERVLQVIPESLRPQRQLEGETEG